MSKQTKSAKKATSDDFVPDGAVNSGSARYLKFENGVTKFRCLSKPIVGWLAWEEKVPSRTQIDDEPEATDEDNKPKKFMAMVVFDYEEQKVKILEMTQQSVIKAIKALAANPDWGSPFSYDLNVEKKGEGMKTKYTVTPSPKKPTSKEIIREANASPCNLDALYENEDPWTVDGELTEYHFK